METQRTAAAHAARRGQVDSMATKLARAQTRYLRQLGIGKNEAAFAVLLDAAGIEYRQQLPVGPYNVDFALTEVPIAVEVVSGAGNSCARAIAAKRTERILGEWHVFEVRCMGNQRVGTIQPQVVDELVAFVDFARGDHAALRQYRVIRADGQYMGSSPKAHRWTGVLRGHHVENPTVGREA